MDTKTQPARSQRWQRGRERLTDLLLALVLGAVAGILAVIVVYRTIPNSPAAVTGAILVGLEILKRVFQEGLETFIAAEEGLPISAVDDATATRSYEILIDGERPSDTTDEQELEYNTEKAIERYFQLGTYWKAYRNQAG